jgi:hypothetical protein
MHIFQWSDTHFAQGEDIANGRILQIIYNAGAHEFGIFYNSLVYSENTNAAKLLRKHIPNSAIYKEDDRELYRVGNTIS